MELPSLCTPVYVSVCIYTMYLTLFPEVIKQEISLPCLYLYHCFHLQILVHSRNTNLLSLKLVSYLLITQNEKVTELLESEALLRIRYLIYRNPVLLNYLFN